MFSFQNITFEGILNEINNLDNSNSTQWENIPFKVNESQYKQCGVTPLFSTWQILFKKVLKNINIGKNYWKSYWKKVVKTKSIKKALPQIM